MFARGISSSTRTWMNIGCQKRLQSTYRDTSHDIEDRDQIPHPVCMGIKFPTPGKVKAVKCPVGRNPYICLHAYMVNALLGLTPSFTHRNRKCLVNGPQANFIIFFLFVLSFARFALCNIVDPSDGEALPAKCCVTHAERSLILPNTT